MDAKNIFPHLNNFPSPSSIKSIPPFTVTKSRGFLPLLDPPTHLPSPFAALETILQRMPIRTADSSPGLLAHGQLGNAILNGELPDLSDEIEAHKHDKSLMNALYRDYSFVASAYLLEPCHRSHIKGQGYGLARDRLPACIARPISKVAALAGFQPFMEYAGSYALFNYRLLNPGQELEYDNLGLVRAFEHGLDPKSSEAGFVIVHVEMVKHSGALVTGAVNALEACDKGDASKFDDALAHVVTAMKQVNRVMESMWAKSKPRDYTSFRTFIFGITSQSMFPNGVVYEGVGDEEPRNFRGESGANDSMIPLCDNLLQIVMPQNPLTEILTDFRTYRPGNHREFLEWVASKSAGLGVKDYALERASSASQYIQALNQVRDFRWRHWCFTREYILKTTAHPTATGGSPIVTWLPNQLQAVLDAMAEVDDLFNAAGGDLGQECQDIMKLVSAQRTQLNYEVEKFCKERKVGV